MVSRILPYNVFSSSAKLLGQAMGLLRVRRENSKYRPRNGHVIINWGSRSLTPKMIEASRTGVVFQVLNNPSAVTAAINKIKAFKTMEGKVSIPPWTEDIEVARSWFTERQDTCVVCRTIVNGHGGAGIVLSTNSVDIPYAPLYTKYIKKRAEYRVHVGKKPDGTPYVIDMVQKARRKEYDGVRDNRIRNTANGYVFKRHGIVVPEDVQTQAMAAVVALGLDFGAVDVIWNERQQKAFVLEVNTAPGIEGTTVAKYAEFFRNNYN